MNEHVIDGPFVRSHVSLQVIEHAKTVEALNQSEVERSAVEQKLTAAVRESEETKGALVRLCTNLLTSETKPCSDSNSTQQTHWMSDIWESTLIFSVIDW